MKLYIRYMVSLRCKMMVREELAKLGIKIAALDLGLIILHKIDKIKELILYNELNQPQTSYKMQYSSAAYLSAQFKKITGLSASFYKQLKGKRENNLENMRFE